MTESAPAERPHVLVMAGPNGAGKSTAAAWVLRSPLGVPEFVNADVIAQGLSGFNSDAVAMKAGRIMLARLKELAHARAGFAFETTLATKHFAPWIGSLRRDGYAFYLLFFWLRSPELAIERVATRVRGGGHHVPDEVVRRRYHRGLSNFFQLYRPLATTWRFYDNSSDVGPPLIASGSEGAEAVILDVAVWDALEKQYSSGGTDDE